MAGPLTEDEQLGLNLKKEFTLKHHPSAHAEFMAEAGRWVVMARGKYNENITIGTGGNEQAAWQSAYKYTNEVFHSNVLAQGAKTAQGIAALKQQAESGALGKLKQSIDKKFNMHVGQYIPVDTEDDLQVLTKDKIKLIDSSPKYDKYKVKFTPTLKPMILPKKPALEEDDEGFAPVPTKKEKPFSSINVKADLTNQTLIQHIGVASNCNVIIQQAFSSKGAFGRKVRLVCKQCNKDKVYFDEAVFHMTPEGIVNELKEFCFAHRHDGSSVEMSWKTVAVPDPKKLENFRRFRQE
jgi:hypothetical protein